jgi:hypothetical protein
MIEDEYIWALYEDGEMVYWNKHKEFCKAKRKPNQAMKRIKLMER